MVASSLHDRSPGPRGWEEEVPALEAVRVRGEWAAPWKVQGEEAGDRGARESSGQGRGSGKGGPPTPSPLQTTVSPGPTTALQGKDQALLPHQTVRGPLPALRSSLCSSHTGPRRPSSTPAPPCVTASA